MTRFLMLGPPPPSLSFHNRIRPTGLILKPTPRKDGLLKLNDSVVHVYVFVLPSIAFGGVSFDVRPLGQPSTDVSGMPAPITLVAVARTSAVNTATRYANG